LGGDLLDRHLSSGLDDAPPRGLPRPARVIAST